MLWDYRIDIRVNGVNEDEEDDDVQGKADECDKYVTMAWWDAAVYDPGYDPVG